MSRKNKQKLTVVQPQSQKVKTRKQYSPEEKVAILRRHLGDQVAVSDLCDEYGIHPTLFYRWQKEFFENGSAAFDRQQSTRQRQMEQKIAHLEDKLTQKHEVLSELMEEHVLLKKHLGSSKWAMGPSKHSRSDSRVHGSLDSANRLEGPTIPSVA